MGTIRRLQLVGHVGTADRNRVRAQHEFDGRSMAGGRRTPDLVATPMYGSRAKLLGGIADGCSVELSNLAPEILVHLDDQGRAHAAAASVTNRPEAGSSLYRLVNPSGPDEPTYAAPTI